MQHIFILLGFLFLALTACKKETPAGTTASDPNIPYFDFKIYNPGNQASGSARATTFEKEWNASAHINRFPDNTSRYFQVFLETYSDEGYTRDQISFGLFDGKVGEYQITNNHFDYNFDDFSIASNHSLWKSDGDLLAGSYEVDTTFHNKIIIDKNNGRTLEGRFSLLFRERVAGSHRHIPSSIYFKNGTFQVKL